MAINYDPAALFGALSPSPRPQPLGEQVADIAYINQGRTRNQKVTPELEGSLNEAVMSVYGPGYTAQIYSGGQPGAGEGGARTGSIRHDHGKAADVYVVGPDGKRVTGDALAPLGQYWAAKKLGGVGLEMRGGGIHLDEWNKPPPGGGMHWNYASKGGRYTPTMREAMQAGLQGQMPGSMAPPPPPGQSPSSVAAAQPSSGPMAPGTPAPPMGPGQTVRDMPIGSMAPSQPTAPPPAVMEAAAPSDPAKLASILGSMGPLPDNKPQFSPVQMQGPSQGQATALTSFIQALLQRQMV